MRVGPGALSVCAVVGDEGRCALQQVRVEPDGTCVTTDGHALLAVRVGNERPENDPAQPAALVPPDVARDCRMRHGATIEVGANNIHTAQGSKRTDHGFTPVEGQYPDWRKLLSDRREKPQRLVGVYNPRYLAELFGAIADAIERATPPQKKDEEYSEGIDVVVRVDTEGVLNIARVDREDGDRQCNVAALMAPIKIRRRPRTIKTYTTTTGERIVRDYDPKDDDAAPMLETIEWACERKSENTP